MERGSNIPVLLNTYKTVSGLIHSFVYLTREGLNKLNPRRHSFFLNLVRKGGEGDFHGHDISNTPPPFPLFIF